MIVEMELVQIIALKKDVEQIIAEIHRINLVHLINPSGYKYAKFNKSKLSAAQINEKQKTRRLFLEVRGLLEMLNLQPENSGPVKERDFRLEEIEEQIEPLAKKVKQNLQNQKALEEDRNTLPLYEQKLKKLIPIIPDYALQPDYATFGLFLSSEHAHLLVTIREYLEELTQGNIEFVIGDYDQATEVVLVIAPDTYSPKIEQLLGEKNIPRYNLPLDINEKNPVAALAAIRARIESLPEKIKSINLELDRFKEQVQTDIMDWFAYLKQQNDLYTVREMVIESEYTVILQGWVPKTEVPLLIKKLSTGNLNHKVLVEKLDHHQLKHKAPVLMKNPGIARPFERVVKLYATPQYQDIDPTVLLSIFLPIFFGSILGDVGYGLLILLLVFILRKKSKSRFVFDLSRMFTFGAFWAIGFGFLYGEFFGTLGEKFGMHAIWLDRTSSDSLLPLLLTAIGIGAAHIVLGLLLGIWQGFVQKSRSQLMERGGMLIGLVGLFFLVGVVADILPEGLMVPSISILVVGIVILAIPIGKAGILVGPIEFIGVIGNILSYIRLAAVGFASVYLARVANELGGFLGSLVVGILVAVLFHALNLVIGVFSPSIHSLRLMYVEFFRKFYDGGGEPYQPFGSGFNQ